MMWPELILGVFAGWFGHVLFYRWGRYRWEKKIEARLREESVDEWRSDAQSR